MPVDGEMYRIVLEKDTLDIWVNGKKAEVAREFVEDGVETHVRFFKFKIFSMELCIKSTISLQFTLGNEPCHILAISSGHRRTGILHKLIMNDNEVPEYFE